MRNYIIEGNKYNIAYIILPIWLMGARLILISDLDSPFRTFRDDSLNHASGMAVTAMRMGAQIQTSQNPVRGSLHDCWWGGRFPGGIETNRATIRDHYRASG